jgi:hypothetical protein
MRVIINADDYGLTRGISKSIIELLEVNAISNTTIMICVDGAEEDCKTLKGAGLSHRAGVHLQTTLENHHKKALSAIDEIPSLVDQEGFFKSHENKNAFDAVDIEREWERQIQKVFDVLGHKPSHIDSHHGVHRVPHLKPVYYKLAQKYGLSVRGGKDLGQIDGSAYDVMSSTICESTWTGQNAPVDVLKEKIQTGLKQVGDGVLEIVAHPGYCDEELMKASSWNTVRENDHKVLLELAKSDWFEKMGIELVQYPNLG